MELVQQQFPGSTGGRRWVIVTGEYPPQRGGVGDYTQRVAAGLVRCGDEVHVFAPPAEGQTATDGVHVHRLPDHFGPRSLRAMSRLLRQIPSPRTLLLQYVPHAFGFRSINVPFCVWWAMQRREYRAVMFHEVSSPIDLRLYLKHSILGTVHRPMAAILIASANQVFTSTDAWRPLLERLGCPAARTTTLAIPSNLPESAKPQAVERHRSRLAGDARVLLGSFGTFGTYVAPLAAEVIQTVLQQVPECGAAVIGRGSRLFVSNWIRDDSLRRRIAFADDLDADEAAAAIAACDVMVQPYRDGVTTRRTSMMASLALGKAVVTNAGVLTEPFWQNSNACSVVNGIEAMPAEAVQLLQSATRREELSAAARQFYEERFSLGRVIGIMRSVCRH